MSRLLRLLCTWLIAVALPLQGMAAVSMLGCATAHATPATTVMPAGHHHDASMAAASAAEGTVHHGHSATEHASHGHADKAGCSVCAACCLGAGLTPASLRLPSPAAVAAELRAPEQTERASPSLGGLERPPRILLA